MINWIQQFSYIMYFSYLLSNADIISQATDRNRKFFFLIRNRRIKEIDWIPWYNGYRVHQFHSRFHPASSIQVYSILHSRNAFWAYWTLRIIVFYYQIDLYIQTSGLSHSSTPTMLHLLSLLPVRAESVPHDFNHAGSVRRGSNGVSAPSRSLQSVSCVWTDGRWRFCTFTLYWSLKFLKFLNLDSLTSSADSFSISFYLFWDNEYECLCFCVCLQFHF